ncbi:MFS transporter [Chitinivorax sp. B]|uniref:AmpG family muropeptide MFS transporter n=1 Tax=Chitinivorax sp. B TaxID=2502235 RepID=UPI0010F5A447|nr:MFS transporter [Chitinivorax sp. B]
MTSAHIASFHRMLIIFALGFASGLPIALTGQAMQAWLTVDGIDIATIGFLSLVGLPYTFKFLWAPLMDRFEPPLLGRRRGWLVITQLALAGALALLSAHPPKADTTLFALIAVGVAFLSASQDVVIDAYRTDVLKPNERGFGSSLSVFGYRLAMILSGGISLIWVDAAQGFGWSWPQVYSLMSGIMLAAAAVSLLALPSVPDSATPPRTIAHHDVIGFLAVLLAVVAGYQLTSHIGPVLAKQLLSSLVTPDPATNGLPANAKKWADLISLMFGIAITLPLGWMAAKLARFETLNQSLASYFSQPGAAAFLLFIILYKLGDAFAGSLTTPFLIKGMGFSTAEVGVVNKVIGIWLTIIGALIGGLLMTWLGLFRSLMLFGVLQLVSNFGFYLVAVLGKGAWGSFELPPFDWVIVSLKQASEVDYLLLSAVAVENITGGMGTSAFVAFLMALCNQRFTATQYALLSAFAAVGRVWVGPLSGVLSESIGWPNFFVLSVVLAVPGLVMLVWLRQEVNRLDTPIPGPLADD